MVDTQDTPADTGGQAARLLGWTLLTPLLALVLVALGGAWDDSLPGMPDPGTLTRVAIPLSQGLRDIAVVLALGMLIAALTCITSSSVRERLVALSGRWLLVWCAAGLVLLVFTWSDASGEPISAANAWDQISFFSRNYDLGRYLLANALLAGVAGFFALLSRTPLMRATAAALALIALWPQALVAHGTGGTWHDLAVNAQFVHLIAVALWGGGVVALALMSRMSRRTEDPTVEDADLRTAAQRFSKLATWCLVALTLGGVVGAWIRLTSFSALDSSYGLFLGLKVLGTVAIGGLGLLQRRRLLDPARGRLSMRRLLLTETLVLVTTAGVAVALNRTPPPPRNEAPLTIAQSLLGFNLPGEPSFSDWFTTWRIDGFWGPLSLLAIVMYLVWMIRLRRRGDSWSILRTVAWVAGWLMLIWSTSGAPGVYGRFMFSMHMIQHMAIATTIPVLLAAGGAITLALRALPARRDGSMGPREWINTLVRSPWASFLGHPIVAGAMFVLGLFVFYFTPFFEVALRTHTGHVLMTLHFLVTGYMFSNVLIGIDPSPHRPTYPVRVLLVMVVFAMHSFFSIALMSTNSVLAEGWFTLFPHSWGDSLAQDQQVGAALGWALGEIPLLMLGMGMVAMWVQADRAERVRFDRHEDRTGDEALAAWNSRFEKLSEHDRS